jgi:hypothetical protein
LAKVLAYKDLSLDLGLPSLGLLVGWGAIPGFLAGWFVKSLDFSDWIREDGFGGYRCCLAFALPLGVRTSFFVQVGFLVGWVGGEYSHDNRDTAAVIMGHPVGVVGLKRQGVA